MPEAEDLASLKIDRDARRGGSPLLTALLVLVVLAAIGSLGAWWLLAGPAAIEVRTAAARATRLDQPATVLNASGYVTARRMATVSSKVTGRVVDVLIEEGMEVEEGQLLAVLDASNTAANLRLAESELHAARTALAETRVRLDEAEVELRRIRPLAERGVVAAAELDRVQANYDSLAARIVQQQDQVEVAASRLALWRQELADREIRAPFAGVVVSKNAQPGEMISPMSAGGSFTRTGIGTIVDMGSLEIEVDVNESYINRVSPGQRVEATLDAYTDWQIPASVIAIVPTADRQRATVKVRIAFDELDPRILPDMGVKVAFRDLPAEAAAADSGGGAPSGVVVPAAALRRDGGRDVVFVVAGDIAERRPITIGSQNENEAVITSGLAAGERVVVEGPAGLADGDLVGERTR
jgi:RND family efflux transporter MFP subunit